MIEDVLRGSTSLFADGAQTVLRGQENRSRRVTILKGNLVANARSESRGVNARVFQNGVYGFASEATYSEEAAKAVLKAATENAKFLGQHAPRDVKPFPAAPVREIALNRAIVDFEQKRIIDLCKEIDAYIEKNLEHLVSRTVVYSEDSMDKIIYSSDASCGHVTVPRCYIYVFLSAETSAGQPVELFEAFGGLGSFEDVFSDPSFIYEGLRDLHKQLMDKREGVYAKAGVKTVVLGGLVSGMIAHEAVGHTVEADLVLGGSVAGPNLGKQVASDLISMVDYASVTIDGAAKLPIYLDDEGIPATDAVLIENGILKGYMNNRESAARFGVAPAGNARAWSFSDEPIIRMRNTAVLPGRDKLSDIIASVDDGYYLVRTGNGQADLTGEFMFGVTLGYEIKNGKLGKAILDTTVSGVAFDMLKTVDMVSDELTWSSSGFCGKKQMIPVSMGGPQMRCKMAIGGR